MKSTLLLVMSIFLLSGCASVIKGTKQPLTFNSDPEGAKVFLDGQLRGETPLTLNLTKNEYSTVMFRKDGYKSMSKPILKKYDGIALLNVFWDFSTTDAITGAIYEYEPGSYYAEMRKESSKESSDKK